MRPLDPHETAKLPGARYDVDQRGYPRLRLAYAIRVDRPGRRGSGLLAHTVTQNLSARGVYFCTPRIESLEVGAAVDVQVTVPHRISAEGRQVMLDLSGRGRIVRLDDPGDNGWNGEDGVAWSGVAIEFDRPLSVEVDWV